MPKEESRKIRIVDFIMSAKYPDNSLMMTSLGVIKEENPWFGDSEQRIYATSITCPFLPKLPVPAFTFESESLPRNLRDAWIQWPILVVFIDIEGENVPLA